MAMCSALHGAVPVRWRCLLLAVGCVVATLLAPRANALVIDSPCCSLLTHVTGEFTDDDALQTEPLVSKEVVPATPFGACEPLTGSDVHGRIALVQRGECNFVMKVWHAQNAGALGVIVMDSAARDEAPHHIIMQRDENASALSIPGVFVAYADGEKLLMHMRRAAPWNPVLVTISDDGELVRDRTQYKFLKRVVAYIFLVSVVCVMSSGLSIAASFLFGFFGTLWRARITKKLPVMRYVPALRQELLERVLLEAHVLDHIVLDDEEDPTSRDDNAPPTHGEDLPLVAADVDTCSICLEDFTRGEMVKVLPCHHFFHDGCITPWLEQRSGSCPLCKQDAIFTLDDTPKTVFGVSLPRVEQILRQEHWFHTFFLMLPASFVSCLLVNGAVSIIRSTWP